MTDYEKIPFIVLAGENKSKYKSKEWKDKIKMNKRYETEFLDGDKKLHYYLDNDKTVLENTIDSVTGCKYFDEDKSVVIGNKKKLRNLEGIIKTIEQKGESLTDNIKQSLDYVYSNNYSGKSIILTGDIPSIKSSEISNFYSNAISKKSDLVSGMVDIKEMKNYISKYIISEDKKFKKFGIHFKDNGNEYNRINPKLTFGNIFLTNENVYENMNELKERFQELTSMKRIFNDERNYEGICNLLQDNDKIKDYPKTFPGLIRFSLFNSNFLRRMFFGNYLLKGKINYSINLNELEEIVQDRVLENKIDFKIARTSPTFGFDVDDKYDFYIANQFIKNNG
ncbi:MAG: hypothetical protein ACOCRX_01105 [Candidatus Woesearchaeota archaeon]